jgi:hypothetical protein
MNRTVWMGWIIGLTASLGASHADVLELTHRTKLQGHFKGADEQTIHFVASNELHLIPVGSALSLVLGTKVPSMPKETQQQARRPAPVPHPVLADASKPAEAKPAGTSAAPPASAAQATPARPPATFEVPLGNLLQIRA